MFRKEELESWLVALGNAITKPLDMYLIGGCAMSFKGIKDRTKDIDIVMLKRSDLNRLREALPAIGYKQMTELEDFYLSAVMVFEKKESRIDLFLRDICKQLQFTDAMVQRVELYKKLHNLNVYLASNEDIFLFKAITDREHDIDDCIELLKQRMSLSVIMSEMKAQTKHHWCFAVYEKLCQIDEKVGETTGLKEHVKRLCYSVKDKAPADFMYAVDKKKHWEE